MFGADPKQKKEVNMTPPMDEMGRMMHAYTINATMRMVFRMYIQLARAIITGDTRRLRRLIGDDSSENVDDD